MPLASSPTCPTDADVFPSQELVNLLLVGRARSNVFDGCRVMGDKGGGAKAGEGGKEGCEDGKRGQKQGHQKDEEEGGGGDRVVLRGVSSRGRVGFLTLFEAYKHVEVCVKSGRRYFREESVSPDSVSGDYCVLGSRAPGGQTVSPLLPYVLFPPKTGNALIVSEACRHAIKRGVRRRTEGPHLL